MTEQYQCQSYSDDNRVVQDCTCGKCGNTPDTECFHHKAMREGGAIGLDQDGKCCDCGEEILEKTELVPEHTPDTEWERVVEEALDILHEAIQHTPIKLSETNGTEYDKGYIFYQDMVVRNVLDNTPKLKKLLTNAFTSRDTYWKERVRKVIEENQGDYESKNPEINWIKAVPVEALDTLLDNLK